MNPLERVGLWLMLAAFLPPMFLMPADAFTFTWMLYVGGGVLFLLGIYVEKWLRRRWPNVRW